MSYQYDLSPNALDNSCFLFSKTPVVQESTAPVVIVGLPRSGSSFLSHILCQLEDWYVFDDLYPYQQAQALGINIHGTMTAKQFKQLLFVLCLQARLKIIYSYDFFSLNCTLEDIDELEAAMQATFAEKSISWSQFIEEWITRLALYHNCCHWGYKNHQDFVNMDTLSDMFPGIRFIFIMRDPAKMMNSMKNLPIQEGGDGDARQYHPVVYSLYWKMAYQTVQQFIQSGRAPVKVIKFEDLVQHPTEQAQAIAEFLQTRVSTELSTERKNSSFKQKQVHDFTPTEAWISQQLIGDQVLQSAGYSLDNAQFRIQDVPEVVRLTLQFTRYQLQRFIKSKRG